MNILFYTSYKISETKGGTEHTTLTVAKQLHFCYHCKCWAAHIVDSESPDSECFEKQYLLKRRKLKGCLRQIILNNHIDVVLSEGGFLITEKIDEIRKEDNLNIKNIFVHHFTPGWEENFRTKIDYVNDIKEACCLKKTKPIVKFLLYPILRHTYLKSLPLDYKRVYISADKVVLLTKGYIPLFQEYGNIDEKQKFYVIPNALSLPDIFDKSKYNILKKKKVLVISRLEEIQKRISLIIKIWEQVSKDKRAQNWSLEIGGEGVYLNNYKSYVERYNIKNIEFLGRVQPIPYYKEASIFLMTSRSEGFPLTLNEAMQYGVVPLAFNSFESVKDIINDGENGFLIPELDMEQYSEKLLTLMSDHDLLRNMAMNAIDSCQRYTPEQIGKMWWKLLLNQNKEDN